MNVKQRIVLLIGALVFVALGVYTPWHDKGSSVKDVTLGGYGEPPAVAAAAGEYDSSLEYSLIFKPPRPSSRIDLSRLGVEWLSVIALTGSLIVILGKRRINTE